MEAIELSGNRGRTRSNGSRNAAVPDAPVHVFNKGIQYLGATHCVANGENLDLVAVLSSIKYQNTKPVKAILEVHATGLAVLAARDGAALAKVSASMIIWAGFNESLRCIAFVDSAALPAVVHAIKVKHDATVVHRHIMHKLGIETRMARRHLARNASTRRRTSVTVLDRGMVAHYDAWFLGSVPGDGEKSHEKVGEAFRIIKTKLLNAQRNTADAAAGRRPLRPGLGTLRGKTVVLAVSAEGLRTLDAATRSILQSHFITHLQYACELEDQDTNQELLGVVVSEPALGRSITYFYVCAFGQAATIAQLLSETMAAMSATKVVRRFFDSSGMSTDHDMFEHLPKCKKLPRECVVPVAPLAFGKFGPIGLGCLQDTSGNDVEDDATELFELHCIRHDATPQDHQDFAAECAMLSSLHHDNIVKVFGACFTEMPWFTVASLSAYGNLRDVLITCRESLIELHESEHLHLCVQLAAALEYLHAKRVVHMDICSQHCLLGAKNHLRLSGFGSSQRYEPDQDGYELKERLKFNLRWLAPKIFTRTPRRFTEASDVWSFGVTAWEIFTDGEVPYAKLSLEAVMAKVPKGQRLAQPSTCRTTTFSLISSCWQEDFRQRPTFAHLRAALQEEAAVANNVCPPRMIGPLLNPTWEQQLVQWARESIPPPVSGVTAARASSSHCSDFTLELEDAVLRSITGGTKQNPLFHRHINAIYEQDGPSDSSDEEADPGKGQDALNDMPYENIGDEPIMVDDREKLRRAVERAGYALACLDEGRVVLVQTATDDGGTQLPPPPPPLSPPPPIEETVPRLRSQLQPQRSREALQQRVEAAGYVLASPEADLYDADNGKERLVIGPSDEPSVATMPGSRCASQDLRPTQTRGPPPPVAPRKKPSRENVSALAAALLQQLPGLGGSPLPLPPPPPPLPAPPVSEPAARLPPPPTAKKPSRGKVLPSNATPASPPPPPPPPPMPTRRNSRENMVPTAFSVALGRAPSNPALAPGASPAAASAASATSPPPALIQRPSRENMVPTAIVAVLGRPPSLPGMHAPRLPSAGDADCQRVPTAIAMAMGRGAVEKSRPPAPAPPLPPTAEGPSGPVMPRHANRTPQGFGKLFSKKPPPPPPPPPTLAEVEGGVRLPPPPPPPQL